MKTQVYKYQNPIAKIMKRKKNLFRLMMVALIAAFWTGCTKDYDYVQPKVVVTAPISFSNDIYSPILNPTCNKASCHLNDANSPDLSTESIAYAQMWTNDNGDVLLDTSNGGANAANSILYQRITLPNTNSKRMPGGKNGASLTNAQIATILAWIQQGAKNN